MNLPKLSSIKEKKLLKKIEDKQKLENMNF